MGTRNGPTPQTATSADDPAGPKALTVTELSGGDAWSVVMISLNIWPDVSGTSVGVAPLIVTLTEFSAWVPVPFWMLIQLRFWGNSKPVAKTFPPGTTPLELTQAGRLLPGHVRDNYRPG